VLAIPVSKYFQDSFWPQWLQVVSVLVIGIVFLIYAITGRPWPRAYGEKIGRINKDLNDR
jgi:hypothetical protein